MLQKIPAANRMYTLALATMFAAAAAILTARFHHIHATPHLLGTGYLDRRTALVDLFANKS